MVVVVSGDGVCCCVIRIIVSWLINKNTILSPSDITTTDTSVKYSTLLPEGSGVVAKAFYALGWQ